MEGLDLGFVEKIFGKKSSDKILVESSRYQEEGKLKVTENKIVLTKEGKLFADGIASDLFFD